MSKKTKVRRGLSLLLSTGLVGCSGTVGQPLDPARLGYHACDDYYECGAGRFCHPQSGACYSQCRSSADCVFFGEGLLCNRLGECLERGGAISCTNHAECPEKHFCNGKCSSSGATCGGVDEGCPLPGETCSGFCSANCGVDDDCRESCQGGSCSITGVACQSAADCTALRDQYCTPLGQCLGPGWERWVPPGRIPPAGCRSDDECFMLGFSYRCDCDKQTDPRTGREFCHQGQNGVCVKNEEPLDFGNGPRESVAHTFIGLWGMRVEIGVVTVGLPLVGSHNSYSSNLFLVKIEHHNDDELVLKERLCQVNIINFNDDDTPYQDVIWMVIPAEYLRSLPILTQTATVSSAERMAPFDTSRLVELRGCVLGDPSADPLPTRSEFESNPADPRIYDQDGDGHPGMTVYVDGVIRGRLYNIQRWSAAHHGQILDADHIRGLSSAESQEVLLGTSDPVLDQQTTTSIHPHADRTYFRLLRLANDFSCSDLIRLVQGQDCWLRHTDHLMDVSDP